MLAPNQWFEDFQKNMSELLAKTPAADIERTMKAFMVQAFARMDLVTREDFEVQAALLARTLKRVDELEVRVKALESPAVPVMDAAPGSVAPEGPVDNDE